MILQYLIASSSKLKVKRKLLIFCFIKNYIGDHHKDQIETIRIKIKKIVIKEVIITTIIILIKMYIMEICKHILEMGRVLQHQIPFSILF